MAGVVNCSRRSKKGAKIKNRYSQVPHMTQDTIESNKTTI